MIVNCNNNRTTHIRNGHMRPHPQNQLAHIYSHRVGTHTYTHIHQPPSHTPTLHQLTFVSHDYDFSSETSPSVSMTTSDDGACRVSVTSLTLHCERTHWNEVTPASSSCPPDGTTSSPILCSGEAWTQAHNTHTCMHIHTKHTQTHRYTKHTTHTRQHKTRNIHTQHTHTHTNTQHIKHTQHTTHTLPHLLYHYPHLSLTHLPSSATPPSP